MTAREWLVDQVSTARLDYDMALTAYNELAGAGRLYESTIARRTQAMDQSRRRLDAAEAAMVIFAAGERALAAK